MPRAKKGPDAAAAAVSLRHAKEALAWFRAAKQRALKEVAGERVTKRHAVDALQRHYSKLCDVYLRVAGTTYDVWCEVVKPELDEVVAALHDDAVWDRLVDTYQEREHG